MYWESNSVPWCSAAKLRLMSLIDWMIVFMAISKSFMLFEPIWIERAAVALLALDDSHNGCFDLLADCFPELIAFFLAGTRRLVHGDVVVHRDATTTSRRQRRHLVGREDTLTA